MAVRRDKGGISIALTYPSGYQRAYQGTYNAKTGAFNTPDVQYGRNPLTGTFVRSNGAFSISDGREHTQNVYGVACIGGYTAEQHG